MFKSAKVIRIIPDQPSKGGSKTAVTSFTQNLDTRIVHDLMVYLGRWRTMPMAQDYGLYVFPNQPCNTLSIHNYLSYDTSNALLLGDSVILSHVTTPTNGDCIFNHTKGFTLRCDLVIPNSFTPAVFVNIKNRCFICWGGAANFIDSDPTLTFNDPTKIYDIGVNPPATPPTYNLSGFLDYTNPLLYYISYTNGSNKVNGLPIFPTIAPIWGSNITSVIIGGVSGTLYQLQNPGYISTFTIGGTCTGTGGTPTLTINGFHFPPNGDWNGLAINIAAPNAESNIIASYTYSGANTVVTLVANLGNNHTTAAYTVTGEQLVLAGPFTGGTLLGTGQVRTFFGALSWVGSGPQYAYAYYDPVSGHVSNASPILQITERDQGGVTVELTNIMPSPGPDQDRFTQILIFRTLLAGGAVLFPISTAFSPTVFENVPNTPGSHSYTDSNPDSSLLVAGGLQAPIVSNAKPPIFFHMAYWDQRLWGVPVDDPSNLLYSGDFVQIPFGIAEESFPSTNQLRISSDDGRVTGMSLIGGELVITTERYSYTIAGDGTPQNYRFVRLGSSTFGVGDYQMTEFPGETSDTSSAMIYLGRDSRLYLLAPSYGNVSVSDPVADAFQNEIGVDNAKYAMSRVHYFTAPNQRLVLASLPGRVMMYDFDRKVWIETHANIDVSTIVRPEAFTTIYGGARPVDLIFGSGGTVYSWMRNEPGLQGAVASYIELPVLDFGRKSKKQLHFVRVYTTAPSGSVFVLVYPDETTGPYVMAATTEPDPQYSIYATPSSPTDDPNAKELVAFPISPATGGLQNLFAHRFRIRVVPPQADGQRYDTYAIDVCYADLESVDEASP